MIITGASYRKIEEKKDYSFYSDFIISNTTGDASFGFSGEGQKITWDFKKGRILDPQGNYTYSYLPNSKFNLSGDITANKLSYYVDGNLVSEGQSKNDFVIQRLCLDSTGTDIDLQATLSTSGQAGFSVSPISQFISSGGQASGFISNTGDSAAFEVFNISVNDSSFTGIATPTNTLPFRVSGTNNTVLTFSGNQNITENDTYSIPLFFRTTIGDFNKNILFTGQKALTQEFFSFTTVDNSDFTGVSGVPSSGGNAFVTKTGDFSISAGFFSGADLLNNYPINAELSYSSGFTGEFVNSVTGINIVTTGSGYNSDVVIDITGGGFAKQATATAVRYLPDFEDVNSSGIQGALVTSAGSGYTSTPSLVFFKNVFKLNLTSQGSGYTGNPSLVFSDSTGLGASGTASTGLLYPAQVGITSLDITFSGSGYTGVPEVTFVGGTGDSFIAPTATALTGIVQGVQTGITGLNLISNGSGYTGNATLNFAGGTGSSAILASGIGITGETWPSQIVVNSVNLITGGSGYLSAPTLTFSGGTGISGISASAEVVMAGGASGTALVGSYSKSFTGQFNLFTGIGNYEDYRSQGYYTSPATGYINSAHNFSGGQSSLDIRVTYETTPDVSGLVARLFVSGSGSNTFETFITGLR